VIGAFLGASVWRLFEPVFPSMGHSPAPYVIVGMMACFGGISRAPLAVMLMVAAMTGSLSILTPAMVAVGISWLIVRRNDDTIYRSQLKSRADAPAQRILAGLPLLGAIPTIRAMATPRLIVSSDMATTSAKSALERANLNGAPVDNYRQTGAQGYSAVAQQLNILGRPHGRISRAPDVRHEAHLSGSLLGAGLTEHTPGLSW
jgi:hypothetical protein